MTIAEDSADYRMASRKFKCYECDKDFKKTVSIKGQMSQVAENINCPSCGSDFLEETTTALEQIQRVAPQQRPTSAQPS